jgi:hypothetical protein
LPFPPGLVATWTTTATTATAPACSARRRLLLQPAASPRSDSLLLLLTLSLEQRRTEKRNLFPLVDSAQDLRVVEIADPDAHHPRRIFLILLYEYHLGASPATAGSGAASSASLAGLPSLATTKG